MSITITNTPHMATNKCIPSDCYMKKSPKSELISLILAALKEFLLFKYNKAK